jgi:hypothetical protein
MNDQRLYIGGMQPVGVREGVCDVAELVVQAPQEYGEGLQIGRRHTRKAAHHRSISMIKIVVGWEG